jgi:5-methylcytosine-specific restriction protein A
VLVQSGRCAAHERQRNRAVDERRGNSSERGYDAAWQRFRAAYLAEHPLCVDCEPRISISTDVHHMKKVRDYPELRLDPDNCMALCHACHSARTKRGE